MTAKESIVIVMEVASSDRSPLPIGAAASQAQPGVGSEELADSKIDTLTKEALKFGVAQPRIFIRPTLLGSGLGFDVFYASGIETDRADILTPLAHVEGWTDKARKTVTIIFTDSRNKFKIL